MRREIKNKDKSAKIEFTNLKDWHNYILKLPTANCLECEYAKQVVEEVKFGQLIYEPGDILCVYASYYSGILGIQFPETCRLSDFNYDGNILFGQCEKLQTRHRINVDVAKNKK
ncbi:MAG: hypothetical protein PHD96_00580 [Candidatus Pacebacteria bacterium]|nr:hypothetical protein [Candidatus Paceibacterota bacterium]